MVTWITAPLRFTERGQTHEKRCFCGVLVCVRTFRIIFVIMLYEIYENIAKTFPTWVHQYIKQGIKTWDSLVSGHLPRQPFTFRQCFNRIPLFVPFHYISFPLTSLPFIFPFCFNFCDNPLLAPSRTVKYRTLLKWKIICFVDTFVFAGLHLRTSINVRVCQNIFSKFDPAGLVRCLYNSKCPGVNKQAKTCNFLATSNSCKYFATFHQASYPKQEALTRPQDFSLQLKLVIIAVVCCQCSVSCQIGINSDHFSMFHHICFFHTLSIYLLFSYEKLHNFEQCWSHGPQFGLQQLRWSWKLKT